MKVKEIGVELSVTRNLGDYNSVKVLASAVATLDPNDTLNEAYSEIWLLVEDEVEAKVREALER